MSSPVNARALEKTFHPGSQRISSLQLVGRGATGFPSLIFLPYCPRPYRKQDSALFDPISPQQTVLRDEAQAFVTGAAFNCPLNAIV